MLEVSPPRSAHSGAQLKCLTKKLEMTLGESPVGINNNIGQCKASFKTLTESNPIMKANEFNKGNELQYVESYIHTSMYIYKEISLYRYG